MLLQISTTEHMLKCVATSRSALHLVSQLKMDSQKIKKHIAALRVEQHSRQILARKLFQDLTALESVSRWNFYMSQVSLQKKDRNLDLASAQRIIIEENVFI